MSTAARLPWTRVPLDTLVVALASFGLATLLLVQLEQLPWWVGGLIAAPGAITLGAICPSARWLVRGRALGPERRLGTFASLSAAGSVAGAASAGVTTLFWASFRELGSARGPLLLVGSGFFFYVASALYYAARQAEQEAGDAQRQSLSASLRAREAELSALSAKVNPHFLFNSLTSIAALTTRDPAGARKMALDLAALLRDRLGNVDELVPLAEELATIRLYLDIEQVRFAERLRVVTSIDEKLLDWRVPKLVLQPLVENAIKHGIAGSDDGGIVRIEAERQAKALRLRVTSPLSRRAPERGRASGLGQRLVRGRLESLYAERATTEFGASGDEYVSTLYVPQEGEA